ALHGALPTSTVTAAEAEEAAMEPTPTSRPAPKDGAAATWWEVPGPPTPGAPRAPDRFKGISSFPTEANTICTRAAISISPDTRSEEHTSELQSRENLVCRLL